MCRLTTAIPSRSCTSPMSPICTPETRTVCPWAGATACAVENSASIVNCDGERQRDPQTLVVEDVTRDHQRQHE